MQEIITNVLQQISRREAAVRAKYISCSCHAPATIANCSQHQLRKTKKHEAFQLCKSTLEIHLFKYFSRLALTRVESGLVSKKNNTPKKHNPCFGLLSMDTVNQIHMRGEVIQEHRRQTDSKLLLCACPFLECYMENAVKCTLLGKCIHNPFFEKIFHVLYTEKHGQIPQEQHNEHNCRLENDYKRTL